MVKEQQRPPLHNRRFLCFRGCNFFPSRLMITSLGITWILFHCYVLYKKNMIVVLLPEQQQGGRFLLDNLGHDDHQKATISTSTGGPLGFSSKPVQDEEGSSSSSFESNYQHALECLGYNNNDKDTTNTQQQHHQLLLQYPIDPFDHYQAIHRALSQWNDTYVQPHTAAGYSGPWIENFWTKHFQSIITTSDLTNQNFSKVFGPYIPIFLSWTSIWVNEDGNEGPRRVGQRYQYPEKLLDTLERVLRPNVLYITVNQNDDGLPGNDERFASMLFHGHNHHSNTTANNYNNASTKFHILVLSAGGYGHVPIPLLKQREFSLQRKIPVSNRTHFVSYVGGRGNAPKNLRNKMIDIIHNNNNNNNKNKRFYYGKEWRNFMADSKFSLCPRGFGRTSYHVMETLQLGLIPIQVYLDNDIPWLPYYYNRAAHHNNHDNDDEGSSSIMEQVGYTTSLSNLSKLLQQLQQTMTDTKIQQMEQKIEQFRQQYFTFEGVMIQIERFMMIQQQNPSPYNNNKSDLICQQQSGGGLPINGPATNRPRWFPPSLPTPKPKVTINKS